MTPVPRPGLNPRQELFAQQIASGVRQTEAAVAAGFATRGAHVTASRLLRKDKILARITELRAPAVAKVGITAQRILDELARIAFSDMRQFAKWGPGGVRLLDSSQMSDDAARCVSEVGETTTKDGGSQRFKLHDKIKAIELLGKELGMFADRLKIGDLPDDLTEAELEEIRTGKIPSRLRLLA